MVNTKLFSGNVLCFFVQSFTMGRVVPDSLENVCDIPASKV